MKKWNDEFYSKKAKEEGYFARSAYKLQEIDNKWHMIKGAKLIIDLGASPGSWIQYCLKKEPNCKIIAIDINEIKVSSNRVTKLIKDVNDVNFDEMFQTLKADLLLSDMAPSTSGNSTLDSVRSYKLAVLALNIAKKSLKKNSNVVIKLFMGSDFENFRIRMRESFESIQLFRPKSTRQESREIYFIGFSLKT